MENLQENFPGKIDQSEKLRTYPPPLLPQPHTSPNLLSVDCCWDREGIGKVRSCSDADIDLEKEKESKQSSES